MLTTTNAAVFLVAQWFLSFRSGLSTVPQHFQTTLWVRESAKEVILWKVSKSKIIRYICVWEGNAWCVGGTCKRPSEILGIAFNVQSWKFLYASLVSHSGLAWRGMTWQGKIRSNPCCQNFANFFLLYFVLDAFLQSSLRCLVHKNLATLMRPSFMQGGRRVAVCQEKHQKHVQKCFLWFLGAKGYQSPVVLQYRV